MSTTDTIHGVFPTPVSITKRDTNLTPDEEKDIGKIIEEGLKRNQGNSASNDTYIFNGKLKKLKQFCEEHIKTYVKEVIDPKEELDIYITQSWLNVTKPGEIHHEHSHPNSIVSGVFYISTEEDDNITFTDPNYKLKNLLRIQSKEYNLFNSVSWFFPAITNELILFPSWVNHKVEVNEKATRDRISLSFNTFVRSTLGSRKELSEVIVTPAVQEHFNRQFC